MGSRYLYCYRGGSLKGRAMADPMRASEDRSGLLVTCTGNPCQSTGTCSPVSTGDLPVLPVQVTNSPDRSSEVLIKPISGGERGASMSNQFLICILGGMIS